MKNKTINKKRKIKEKLMMKTRKQKNRKKERDFIYQLSYPANSMSPFSYPARIPSL
jgi:hypothetical protein